MDVSLLTGIPLLSTIEPLQLQELAALFKEHKFPAQQPVFWIGDNGDRIYIIQEGRVAVSFPDVDGHETILAILGPGQFFGDLALLDGGPRTATARAQEDCSLLSLDRDTFHQFVLRHPQVGLRVLGVVGQRQRELLMKLRTVRNANEVVAEKMTLWETVAEVIARISSSSTFVIAHVFIFAAWIGINAAMKDKGFDPFPFGLLTVIVSLEAIFLSLFVLISQGQSGKRDRIRADLDYQVNLKAHLEIMELHGKLDALTKLLHVKPDAAEQININREIASH